MIPKTSGEISILREPYFDVLQGSATIYPRQLVSVGGGSYRESWDVAGATVEARISPSGLKTVEQPVAGRTGAVMFFIISMPVGTTINSADQILMGGVRYQVVGQNRRTTALSLRVDVVQVEGDAG